MDKKYRNNLKIFHTNIRSLRYKFDMLLEYLDSFNDCFDIIVLTEVWLKNSEMSFYDIPDYKCIHALRNADRAGGVIVYIKDNINFYDNTVSISDSEIIEAILCDYKLTICSIYRRQNGKLLK